MKLTKILLRDNKIYNSWEIAKRGELHFFISYSAAEPKSCKGASWHVVGVGFKTDSDAAWYDNGCKAFQVWGRKDKEDVLAKAKEWASQKYGIAEWERDPFGGWQDKRLIDLLRATLVKTVSNKS